MRYKSLAKEFKGTAKEPVGLRCSFPCPSKGHAQGSVAGSTGDLGNMLRSRLHSGRPEAHRPPGGNVVIAKHLESIAVRNSVPASIVEAIDNEEWELPTE